MKKNKFSKALKHLKSKKLDEKIKKLDEAAPTNNMSGVYQVTPRADTAFRLGELDPPKRFVAPADGNWPAGIPGTAGEPYYERPAGYWKGAVDWETITEPKFGHNAAQSNNTDGLIDPVTNAVKTQLPPNSRSFILGPLVDGFVPNHVSDAFTRIGYIEKDTRQFVLLGIINGEWFAGLNEVSGAFGNRTHPVWDGSSSGFSQVNPNFTLDMALWFRNEMLKGRFVKNVSYNAVGGIPQQGNPDPDSPQNFGGNGVGGGSGNAGDNPDGTGTGVGSGGEPDVGTPQGDPDNNDIDSLDLHGLNKGSGSGEVSFKPDLDWYKRNKKKPPGAPDDWSDMSDKDKEDWINENEPEEKFNYEDGKFVPDKNNAVPDVPSTPNFPIPDEPLGDPNFNYDPINDPADWTMPENPNQPSPPNFPDLDGPITGNDPDDFLAPKLPEPPNPDDYGTSRTASAAYKRALREWEKQIEEAQQNNPFLETNSGLTPFRVGLNIGRGILDNAIYGNTDLLFKGLDSATPNYIPDFKGAVGGPEWFKKLFDGKKLTAKGPLSIFSRDLQYFTPDFNTALKYAGEGGSIVAMPRPESVRGLKNIWKSGVSRGFDPFKGIETIVKTSDSVALESMTTVIKLGEPGSEEALKALAKKAATTNKVASKAAKFVPFLNWGIAAADVSLRVADGDYLGATLGGLSVIPGPVGWAMTALQLGYDMAGGTEGIVEKIYKLPSGSLKEAYMPADELGLPKDKDEYIKDMIVSLHFQGVHPELLSIIANAMRGKEFSKGQKKWIDNNLEKYVRGLGAVYTGKKKGKKENKIAESFTSAQRRILREVKKPVLIEASPKTTKLKGYKPNFKGKYSPQNTPDVTASKRSDQLVMAKNAEGQAWTVGDKYQKGWETTGRMNHVYARVGESNKFFEEITANNSADVDRKMQEHLNHVYHNKAMLKIDSNYKSPFIGNDIDESETYDNKINDPLFTKVAKRLKKEIDYPKKPAAKGYPNEAPPKVDPNSGYHPKFGKRYKYDKLDPISAKTMAGAPTGDPEIDANVKKAAKVKEDWRSDLKNLWLGAEREEWKNKLQEGMTTGDTFTYSIPGKGDEILHKKQTGFTGDGDINDFDHSTGIHNGGEFTGMTSFTDHENVEDPHDLGKLVRSYSGFDSRNHRVVPTNGDGFNGTSDGRGDFWPGKSGGFRGVTFRGSYNSFPYTAIGGPTDENHPMEPVDVSSNETKLNYTTPEPSEYMSNRVGSCLFVGGGPGSPGVPRLAAFKAVDTTEMDTISLNWFTTGLIYTSGSGDDRQSHTRDSTRFTDPGDDIFIYYWAGDKEGAQSFAPPTSVYGGKSHDGWRPLHISPQGVADFNYSSIIIPHKAMKDGGGSFRGPSTEWAGYRGNTFYNSKLTLPPWARDASTRFMIVQNQISTGTAYAVWGITSLNFQRQQAMSVGVPLDDPQAVSFIRTGNPNMTAKERKKKVIEMLRASRAYTTQKYGKDFPYRTQLEPEKESQYTPAELQADIERRQAINRKQKQSAARARQFRSTGRVGGSRGRGFRGYKRTGRDSKGMTTRARVNPKDIIGSI